MATPVMEKALAIQRHPIMSLKPHRIRNAGPLGLVHWQVNTVRNGKLHLMPSETNVTVVMS